MRPKHFIQAQSHTWRVVVSSNFKRAIGAIGGEKEKLWNIIHTLGSSMQHGLDMSCDI